MYRVLWSGSPNSTLATSSGVSIVPRCLPCGETIHTPHATRRRFPDVPLYVDLQAVGDPWGRIAADVDEHLAVGDGVVGQDAVAPHVLVAAAVRVENFFVGRQGQAVWVRDVVDDPGHFAALDHVDALEVQALARILIAQAQAAVGVGEVDRAVLLDDDVVRAVELLAFEAVGEHGALAVLFDPVDRPSGPGGDDEPALPVEREPVRADHVELLEQGIARILAIGLLEPHAPDVRQRIAASLQVDGRLALGRELVDHVRGDIAQEQVAALLDPDEPFRKPEAAFHQLQLGVGGHQLVERRIESHDGGRVALRARTCSARHESREQDGGHRRVFHESLDHIPRILPISAIYGPAFRPSATTVSSPFSIAWRMPCSPSLTQWCRRIGELSTFLRVSTSSLNSCTSRDPLWTFARSRSSASMSCATFSRSIFFGPSSFPWFLTIGNTSDVRLTPLSPQTIPLLASRT